MSSRLRIVLYSHSIASWAAFGVLWIQTLAQLGRPPIDRQFWLIFGLTECLAPFWLPVSAVIYTPATFNNATAIIALTYLPAGLLAAWWFGRRERRKLTLMRSSANLCVRCGYDLRATPDVCPECGTAPGGVNKRGRTNR